MHIENVRGPSSGNVSHLCSLGVSGRVGSGKTTLLYSIMDETEHKNGDMKVRGKIAYVE